MGCISGKEAGFASRWAGFVNIDGRASELVLADMREGVGSLVMSGIAFKLKNPKVMNIP